MPGFHRLQVFEVCEEIGGKVHMRARMALEDADVANGRMLTCQSVPASDKLSLEFR